VVAAVRLVELARSMRADRQPRQAVVPIPAQPVMHRLARHPERLHDLGHRHTDLNLQNGPIPLLHHAQLHQHSAECHAK
jgi:hypothetical protein